MTPLRVLLEILDEEPGEKTLALPLAPDDASVTVPNPRADAPFDDWHKTTFVNYLRIAFQCGGFPGWEDDKNAPRQELARLSEGLLLL